MSVVAAAVAVAVLVALAALQVLVAGGRPYGRLVWGGRHVTLPHRLRVGSALAVPLYAGIAAVLLARAGVFGTPAEWTAVIAWVLVAYFASGVILNGISRSRPERAVMTPVCAILAVCSLVLAVA